MRARLLVTALLATLLAGSVPPAASAGAPDRGQLIVHYVPGTPDADRAAVERAAGVTLARVLPGGSREVRLPAGAATAATLALLRADARVTRAVRNHVARLSAVIPNDPGAGQGWQAAQWNFAGPASVNAPEAWQLARDAGAHGGRGVVVAVLDTGVAYQTRGPFRRAPDLNKTRFVRGYDFVDEDRYPNDENGHGTHVTGTIAQSTDNGIGVTGLAYRARIMPLRVLDSQGAGDASSIARAIRFAARNGAHVINMSLEFGSDVRSSRSIPDIVSAIRYAHRRRVTIVAASGNEGYPAVAYPARTGHVISVGATTEHACRAEYSNTGPSLDLVAPGGGTDYTVRPGDPDARPDNERDAATCDAPNADTGGRDVLQQTFTRTLRTFGLPPGYQGTSMAAPHVSASIALLVASKRLGANPTPVDIERRLEQTARDLGPVGYDRAYGWGLVNPAAALGP
jgi:serine protease